jgi:hypothetical protein
MENCCCEGRMVLLWQRQPFKDWGEPGLDLALGVLGSLSLTVEPEFDAREGRSGEGSPFGIGEPDFGAGEGHFGEGSLLVMGELNFGFWEDGEAFR